MRVLNAVILFCLGFLTTSGKEIIELEDRNLANEKVYDAILYAYRISKRNSPNFLSRGDQIFEVDRQKDLAISSDSTVHVEYQYSDSEHTADKKVALSMGVEASYGAFSASASMKVSSSRKESIKTVRMDVTIKAIKYEVSGKGTFRTFPQEFLTDNFKRAVKELSNEDIERDIGIFYAKNLKLGGELRKSYTMQATADDTEKSVSAELKAKYGGALVSVGASFGASTTSRTTNKNAQMKISFIAMGGDTAIWLGKGFDGKEGSDKTIQRWAKSVNDDNLYPSDFLLRPLWDMVKKVDLARGQDYERYLKAKWAKQGNAFNPSHFLDSQKEPTFAEKLNKCKTDNYDWQGADIWNAGSSSFENCAEMCRGTTGCEAVTFLKTNNWCWLKSRVNGNKAVYDRGFISLDINCMTVTVGSVQACTYEKTDFPGSDIANMKVQHYEDCINTCKRNRDCKSVTYVHASHHCWLKRQPFGDKRSYNEALKSVNIGCIKS